MAVWFQVKVREARALPTPYRLYVCSDTKAPLLPMSTNNVLRFLCFVAVHFMVYHVPHGPWHTAYSASEMTYIVSGGVLYSAHSLTAHSAELCNW